MKLVHSDTEIELGDVRSEVQMFTTHTGLCFY